MAFSASVGGWWFSSAARRANSLQDLDELLLVGLVERPVSGSANRAVIARVPGVPLVGFES
jgi:hypothetical protein